MTDNNLPERMAAGLHMLADAIENNPELADALQYGLTYSGIYAHPSQEDTAAALGRLARIGKAAGATVSKAIDDKRHDLVLMFGAVRVEVLASRDQVCDRVVVGTKTVTEEVPDPEALAAVPTVTQTREVEEIKWVCRPLLAADHDGPDGIEWQDAVAEVAS